MALHNQQTIAIYRSRRSGEFRIQPYARAGVSSQPFGQQSSLPSNVDESDLLRAILDNLAKNDAQTYSLADAPVYSLGERRSLIRDYQLIQIVRKEEKFHLIPFKKMHNSLGSIDEMTKSIPEGEFLSNGAQLLLRMFKQIP